MSIGTLNLLLAGRADPYLTAYGAMLVLMDMCRRLGEHRSELTALLIEKNSNAWRSTGRNDFGERDRCYHCHDPKINRRLNGSARRKANADL